MHVTMVRCRMMWKRWCSRTAVTHGTWWKDTGHQTGQTTDRKKVGSWEQLEYGNQQLSMYRGHNFTTSNNLSWWWRDWLALANPRHRLLFYDGKSDESQEMTWSKLKINTARWHHERWGQDDDWYLGTRVTFILLKQVEEERGQGGRDVRGMKLAEKQRLHWRRTRTQCSHETRNKENNEGCERWEMGDGEPSQIFYKGSWLLGARRKEREVSLSWHGFFVLREATDTMNPAFENRACAISGIFFFSSFFFFKSFTSCRFVPLTNSISTCRERKQGAKYLATDLCRFHFSLSFSLYDECQPDTCFSIFSFFFCAG